MSADPIAAACDRVFAGFGEPVDGPRCWRCSQRDPVVFGLCDPCRDRLVPEPEPEPEVEIDQPAEPAAERPGMCGGWWGAVVQLVPPAVVGAAIWWRLIRWAVRR